MQVRTVYTDHRFPTVELWETEEGIRVRNGKPGKPLDIVGPADQIAAAFFEGMAY